MNLNVLGNMRCRLLITLCIIHLTSVNCVYQKLIAGFLNHNATLRCGNNRSSKFIVFKDHLRDPELDTPSFRYKSPKYPPYPYYDAPRNLFFDNTPLNHSDNNTPKSAQSAVHKEYMNNAEIRRKGGRPLPPNKNPIEELNRSFKTNHEDYIYSEATNKPLDTITTDLAEYDAIRPGLGPWPSYDEIKANNMDLNTSMRLFLDPNAILERHLQHKPLNRKDVTTIGEARTEQLRWLERSRNDEWPLTYEEFAALPLDMREAYYANRYPVSDEDEQFLMVLNYRRSLGKAPDDLKNPLEFRTMESSYTYTPKDSPVSQDLKNWDDPLDCPWRLRANEVIRDCVSYTWPPKKIRLHTGMDVYDITWLPGVLKILVERTRDDCETIDQTELKLMLLKLEKRIEQLDNEECTDIYKNYLIMLATKPTNSNILHCRRDWNENIGKSVTVVFNDRKNSSVRGILQGSDNAMGLDIAIDSIKHTIPLLFIRKIELTRRK